MYLRNLLMTPEAADNLVSMCFFQVSLSSRNAPKYVTQLACFILQSFICGKIFSLVLVKNKNWFYLHLMTIDLI